MTLGAILGGLARLIATTALFTVVGPLAFAALILLIVFGFGTPLLELLRDFISLGSVSTLASVAVWVLAIIAILAALPPSFIAGAIFSLAAIGLGLNAVWMAWLAVAAAIATIILVGAHYISPESSAVILPHVQGGSDTLRAFAGLNALAFPPATLCWWLTKPLHRARIVA